MKKLGFFLVLSFFGLGLVSAADINTADDLTVTATLQAKYVVFVSDEAPIVLDVAGNPSGVVVGNVNLYTNKKAWQLSIWADNGGYLLDNAVGGTLKIPYSFELTGSINGSSVTFFGVADTGYAGWAPNLGAAISEDHTGRTTASTGDDLTAKVYYEAENGNWVSDLTYTDTVHLIMAAQ